MDVCVYVCVSLLLWVSAVISSIFTGDRGTCLRGKRQIALAEVCPEVSHLGRAAFTEYANDMRANCAWCYRVVLASAKFARTECCMWLCSDAAWLTAQSRHLGVSLLEPLTVNRSILAKCRWCCDSKCMSFWVCLKMCAMVWGYQWNHCGSAVTGGHISTLTYSDVS